ncbi:MAG: hypothetical protein ACE5GL_06235, partial [Calditrichia bacterium]
MIHWFLLLVVMVSGVSVLFSQALPIMIDEQLNRPHHSRFEKTTTAMKPDSNTTLIGRWPNGPCYLSFVVGNYTYINNGGALEILDISNPAS